VGLCGGALGPGLGEPGGEGDGEPHLGLGQFPDHGERITDEEHGQIDLLGQAGEGRGAGDAEDGLTSGVHGVQSGADPLGPGDQLPGDAGVRPALGVRGADDGHGLGTEEAVQIGYVGVQRTAADVQVVDVGRAAVHDG
jgi:hypothetical protein